MNNFKVKWDEHTFTTGEFVSNDHWLVRKKFVSSFPNEDLEKDVDVARVLPTDCEGHLIDTRLVKHEIDSREKERLFKTPQGTKVWLDENYYTMFHKAFPSHDLYAALNNGPVIVMVGDEFVGLIMPRRGDKTVNVHLN